MSRWLSETFWERADRLTELRRAEQREMLEYAELESGHMAFLIRALESLGVSPREASAWLKRLVDEGSMRRSERPVRYWSATAEPPSLFG